MNHIYIAAQTLKTEEPQQCICYQCIWWSYLLGTIARQRHPRICNVKQKVHVCVSVCPSTLGRTPSKPWTPPKWWPWPLLLPPPSPSLSSPPSPSLSPPLSSPSLSSPPSPSLSSPSPLANFHPPDFHEVLLLNPLPDQKLCHLSCLFGPSSQLEAFGVETLSQAAERRHGGLQVLRVQPCHLSLCRWTRRSGIRVWFYYFDELTF